MAELQYQDVDVVISRVSGKATSSKRRYRAQIDTVAAGQASTEFGKPVSDVALENFVLRVGRQRGGIRRIESPQVAAAKDFGAALFNAVFDDEVLGCLRSSMDEARRQGAGVRVRLHLAEAPELVDLPWEYLYYPAMNRFLALDTSTPVVRYLDIPERIQPLGVQSPLRILTMIASPSDYDALSVEQEWDNLTQALDPLECQDCVTVERLEEATLAALQRRLRQQEYHVFHFIGHGGFDEKADDGVLIMEDSDGRSRPVSAQQLGWLLRNHEPLRLAVLNACEGARTSPADPFAGTAQTLVQQGLPAVIAMQFEISDRAAITFSREFYSCVAAGDSVDASITHARMAIFAEDGNDIEWGTPVLYMRSPDGRIFDVVSASANTNDQQEDREQQKQLTTLYSQAQQLHGQQDWQGVIAIFNRIEELNPDYPDSASLLSSARHELAAKKQQERKLKQLYRDGSTHLEAGEWAEALSAFQEIQKIQPLYRDAKARLDQIHEEIGKQAQEREAAAATSQHAISSPVTSPSTDSGAHSVAELPKPVSGLLHNPDSTGFWEQMAAKAESIPRSVLAGGAIALLAVLVFIGFRAIRVGSTTSSNPTVIPPTLQVTVASIVHTLAAPGRLQGPTSIAVDRYGYVYIVDQKSLRIQKFSPTGRFLDSYPKTVPANFSPTSITVGPHGTASVTDINNDQIVRFSTSTGKRVPGFGGAGKFNRPAGIAADSVGNLYVADLNNHRIQKFDPTGRYLRKTFRAQGVLQQPTGVAVDRGGNIYVTDQVTGYVQKMSPSGDVTASWGGKGTGPGQFHRPEQIAVDGQDNVYITDTDNDRIQRFTPSGQFRDSFGGVSTFGRPSGVAVGPQGHIYVTDYDHHRALELTLRP
jgi:tetratricopeptide (TPR) repeat protein